GRKSRDSHHEHQAARAANAEEHDFAGGLSEASHKESGRPGNGRGAPKFRDLHKAEADQEDQGKQSKDTGFSQGHKNSVVGTGAASGIKDEVAVIARTDAQPGSFREDITEKKSPDFVAPRAALDGAIVVVETEDIHDEASMRDCECQAHEQDH